MKQRAAHLELVWKVAKARGSRSECSCCHGAGEGECGWCHGTGVMMVGDTLFCSTDGRNSRCPVCKGKGYVACDECRGTGFKAVWMGPGDQGTL